VIRKTFKLDRPIHIIVSALRHPLSALALTVVLTLPWVAVVLSGVSLSPTGTVVVSGLAVLGASFLLAWGAETAEADVPRAFAIAVLAVLAVAPEYAVDAFYAWQAGAGGATPARCAELTAAQIEAQGSTLARACHDGNLAIANMTGANRILIGLGWSGIALFTLYRARSVADQAVEHRDGFLRNVVVLDRDLSTEIAFLFLATLWAFLVPFRGGIDLVDTIVLVGLYVTYIGVIIRTGTETDDVHVGVPAYLQEYPFPRRVTSVVLLFAYSGVMILTAVEPFAHGLEAIGIALGLPPFFMIQWIAPLASESPELIVVVYLVNKARSTAGFNALISSKLNQWTLLIGTLAVVYSVALGQYGALPFDPKQAAEIWLTAAQSYFAIAVLVNFNISAREALVLLVLFVSQVLIEFLLLVWLPTTLVNAHELLLIFTVIYLVAGTVLLVVRRSAVRRLLGRTRRTVAVAVGRAPRSSLPGTDGRH
jgi:cation:H+ antiporter